MNYYEHHLGDYRRDTMHLSLLEHGIYRQLIDIYYITESPLPIDEAKVARLVGARNPDETESVILVLHEFFKLTEKGWQHARCDGEIAQYLSKVECARTNGKKGGRPRKPLPVREKTDPVSVGNPDVTQTKALQTPDSKHQTPNTKQKQVSQNLRCAAGKTTVPDWIPDEPWAAYLEMRRRIRKPMTDRAVALAIVALGKLRDSGQDPKSVLEQSVFNSWQGLFALKANGSAQGSQNRQEQLEMRNQQVVEDYFKGGN